MSLKNVKPGDKVAILYPYRSVFIAHRIQTVIRVGKSSITVDSGDRYHFSGAGVHTAGRAECAQPIHFEQIKTAKQELEASRLRAKHEREQADQKRNRLISDTIARLRLAPDAEAAEILVQFAADYEKHGYL